MGFSSSMDKLRGRLSRGALPESDDAAARLEDFRPETEIGDREGESLFQSDVVPQSDKRDAGAAAGEKTPDQARAVFEDVQSFTESEEDDVDADLFEKIFDHEPEQEESSVDFLVASLPQVSGQELVRDAERLRVLMSQWRRDFG